MQRQKTRYKLTRRLNGEVKAVLDMADIRKARIATAMSLHDNGVLSKTDAQKHAHGLDIGAPVVAGDYVFTLTTK